MNAIHEVRLPYGDRELALRLPAANLRAVLSPRPVAACLAPEAEIRRALQNPIGCPPLAVAARSARQVVILADDVTRQTPVALMITVLLEELARAGVRDEQVTVLIALGTHRPMTVREVVARFGTALLERVRIVNHAWHDPRQLLDLGVTSNGTPVQVNRLAAAADFLIGLGSIVPHHIPGYSGGAKIVQPGISGPGATGATHFLSTRTRRSYLGLQENVVRAEMESIAGRTGLRAICNVVLDGAGRLVRAFYGHPRLAHRSGVAVARRVYGAPLPGLADIVIAGSHPCDSEFWQAHKALYPADLAVRPGGTIIVVAPCPEGVSVTHAGMLEFTGLDAPAIERLILDGTITETVAGALALAWARVRQRAQVSLVSDGIAPEQTRSLGFEPYASLDDALGAALRRHAGDASLIVLTHAPDTLPLPAGNRC